jgi:hypothetical protein
MPNPSAYVSQSAYPALHGLIRDHIDMQFEDLRTLLYLPIGDLGLHGGMNLLATAAILNAISGASMIFIDADSAFDEKARDNYPRFKRAVRDYFPWQDEDLHPTNGVHVLWQMARNPLVHSFGLDFDRGKIEGRVPIEWRQSVALNKRPLGRDQVEALEMPERPEGVGPTLRQVRPRHYVLSVAGLYWGLHGMLRAMFADGSEMAKAETLASYFPKDDL